MRLLKVKQKIEEKKSIYLQFTSFSCKSSFVCVYVHLDSVFFLKKGRTFERYTHYIVLPIRYSFISSNSKHTKLLNSAEHNGL